MNTRPGFAERLRAGEQLLAVSASTSVVAIEILADCDFDWLFIDAETLPLSMDDVQSLLRALPNRTDNGAPAALVRLNTDNEADIRQVLDIGADGVIIPLVKTAEQARRIVAAAKYPPLGERGMAGARAQGYGSKTADYIQRANHDTVVVVMIEDSVGLSNVEEIAAVPGLDGLFVGSGDLSLSLGLFGQMMHVEMQSAYQRIAQAAQSNKLAVGGFPANEEMFRFCLTQGFSFFLTALDTGLLRSAAQNKLLEAKTWLGQ
ncbi:MAG: HpcH/HpaI aldolase/citrate lyase family protein [Pseudomonadales bacterium]